MERPFDSQSQRNNHRSDFGLHSFYFEIRAHLGRLFA